MALSTKTTMELATCGGYEFHVRIHLARCIDREDLTDFAAHDI
jgi:hypothetical protein